MKINKKKEALLIVRYGAVGILNTLVTIATYFLLRRVGVGPDMANFLSYLAGILNSYVFNRLWVFRSRENRYLREGAVFFLVPHFAGLCSGSPFVCSFSALVSAQPISLECASIPASITSTTDWLLSKETSAYEKVAFATT